MKTKHFKAINITLLTVISILFVVFSVLLIKKAAKIAESQNNLSGYAQSDSDKMPTLDPDEIKFKYDAAVDNLDPIYFATNPETYSLEVDSINISKTQAAEIAQKGFEEAKGRISSEGADNIDSQTITLTSHVANNLFTHYLEEHYKSYSVSRPCYEITRTNSLKCGISIYVDASSGLIIGGYCFGN